MPKYYYDKYNANLSTIYTQDSRTSSTVRVWTTDSYPYYTASSVYLYPSYTFDTSTGMFIGSGSRVTGKSKYGATGYYYFNRKAEDTTMHYLRSYNKDVPWGDDKYLDFEFNTYKYTSSQSTNYSKGSLVQQNIIAEDGTYPSNGRHSDGYWYVKGDRYYNPPTTPPSISIPSKIKGGESFSVSWGDSLYQTGYRLERQLNNGAWIQIVEQVETEYIDIVPKGTTTVNYRVMSYGSGGISGYRTSTTRTVINFPEILGNINGEYVAFEGAWENVNGTWVEIDSIWENVNGTWVEM